MFYNQNIDVPQSAANNTELWDESTIGKLSRATKGQIYIKEIPHEQRGSMYAWRVVDAFWADEDTTMSRFRAYDINGKAEPYAAIGVTWAGCEHRIRGGFRYPPEAGNGYYVPIDNQMNTPESGGYTAVVLDTEYPSEGLAFGCLKTQDGNHKGLVVVFRMFTINAANYPNDFQV